MQDMQEASTTMGGGYWMIRTIRSGRVIEKSQFYVGERKPRKARRKGASSTKKLDANLRDAVKRLAREINCNFAAGDLMLTLTYDEGHIGKVGEDFDAAEREGGKWWRRMSREIKAAGGVLRGIWMTSDTDPETGEVVRLHHHAVISSEGVTIERDAEGKIECATIGGRKLSDIWGNGTADVKPLREQDDYTPIAAYFVAQARKTGDKKKWHPSRNLKKPVIESEKIVTNARELHTPPGATVLEIGKYEEGSGSHYVRYIRKPRPPKVGGHKERAIAAEEVRIE